MRLLMAGMFTTISLLFFSLLSGNFMFGLLITSFLAVMLVMPILASTRTESREAYIDHEEHEVSSLL